MLEIKDHLNSEVGCFDVFRDPVILDQPEYIKLLDSYNCYICTSWQEGGPLPLVEALRRGNIALTTRVGQTDDWVIDGYNGFFCESKADFLDKISLLSWDRSLLMSMRRNSDRPRMSQNICYS